MDRIIRNLALASILYLLSAGVGTVVSIAQHLPARAGGILNGNDVLADFLTVNGTALSAPLFMLVLQVVFTLLLYSRGRVQSVGVMGLAVLGALYTMGQLVEPILYENLNPATFEPLVAAILLTNLAFGLLVLGFGVVAWRGRQARYASAG